MTRTLTSTLTATQRRWAALLVVCAGTLMIVLDTTIVNVALPAMQHDLHFSQSALTWVVNAYLIAFGSFLLVAGRLGDLFGRRRIFLIGLVVFVGASVLCGIAGSQALLIGARFAQGIGGALTSAVVLAIIVTEFTRADEQARAIGIYTFVATAGGSLGLLVGGLVTQALDWHWIFFINVPIGIVTFLAGVALVDESERSATGERVDVIGAALVTIAMAIGVYAIVGAASDGWTSPRTLGFGALSLALLGAFVALESRLRNPILPLRIFRIRTLTISSIVRATLVVGMFSTFFLGSLYVERVLGYDAVQTGAAFLPMTLAVATLSLGTTARLVRHFGIPRVATTGMLLMVAGLGLLTATGSQTAYFPGLFVPFLLMGSGMGLAFAPLVTVAMRDVPRADAGLASGIVNVSMQLSGALGLAVLSTVATDRTNALGAAGHSPADALVGGFHVAYLIAASVVAVGVAIVVAMVRDAREPVTDGVGAGARA